MKSIINGLRYNTENAMLIGEASSDLSITNFAWWKASLYCTPRSRRFFLAGRGGPMTRWIRAGNGNMRTGGDGIIPLDHEEALEWAEQHLTHAEIEAGFAQHLTEA